ncbi:MAG: hypothetical protein DRJ57_04555 [Thermoprotei archaeon]|nr:MAG: hypothetical protein DRJ57_04555 [Thermoprotei archaeon]
MLKAPCERLARYVLPALRGALISYMYNRRRMGQLEIARLTGVSQSAVSRYVNRERGLYRAILTQVPGVREVLEDAAARLERGEDVSLCSLCRVLKERGLLDRLLEVIERERSVVARRRGAVARRLEAGR